MDHQMRSAPAPTPQAQSGQEEGGDELQPRGNAAALDELGLGGGREDLDDGRALQAQSGDLGAELLASGETGEILETVDAPTTPVDDVIGLLSSAYAEHASRDTVLTMGVAQANADEAYAGSTLAQIGDLSAYRSEVASRFAAFNSWSALANRALASRARVEATARLMGCVDLQELADALLTGLSDASVVTASKGVRDQLPYVNEAGSLHRAQARVATSMAVLSAEQLGVKAAQDRMNARAIEGSGAGARRTLARIDEARGLVALVEGIASGAVAAVADPTSAIPSISAVQGFDALVGRDVAELQRGLVALDVQAAATTDEAEDQEIGGQLKEYSAAVDAYRDSLAALDAVGVDRVVAYRGLGAGLDASSAESPDLRAMGLCPGLDGYDSYARVFTAVAAVRDLVGIGSQALAAAPKSPIGWRDWVDEQMLRRQRVPLSPRVAREDVAVRDSEIEPFADVYAAISSFYDVVPPALEVLGPVDAMAGELLRSLQPEASGRY